MDVSNQLDPGRKGISQYYAQLMSDKALDLIRTLTIDDSSSFAHYAANHLNHGRGREEGGLPPQDFQIKVQQSEEQKLVDEKQSEELLARLHRVSSLLRLPRD